MTMDVTIKSEELPLNVKIKQEKVTPEREDDTDPDDEIDRFLNSRPFGDDEKKEIEPAKTSDELIQELFGALAGGVDLLKDDGKKKKKKKRKHSDDEESSSKKAKKSKKSKRVKEEPKSDGEFSDDFVKKIKKEKKDKERSDERNDKKKLSIIIKDFKLNPVEPTSSSSRKDSRERDRRSRDKSREKDKSKDKKKDKERDRDRDRKRKSRDKKSGSDFSLSDEETYRNFYEYHMSSRWHKSDYRDGRSDRVRDWDREKYYMSSSSNRSRYDHDRRYDRYDSRHQHRSRSKSQSSRRSPIDKKKLLEIARKNAISMVKNGLLPKISNESKEKLLTKIRHGGKTIEELTNYCQKLSRAEDLGELSELSDSDVDAEGMPRAFHHPFEVKDRGPIVMNIRNSVPIAPKQASELKAIMAQFPVSSGKHHNAVENTWIPVTTTKGGTTTSTTITTSTSSMKSVVTLSKQIQEQLPELAKPKSVDINPVLTKPYDWKSDDHYCKSIVPALEAPPGPPPCDVSEIISQRLNAMRKLQDNPNDVEATKTLYETQQNMSAWATSKYTPGQFLGSTDVQVLSQKELAAGSQAWARKDQLLNTAPVTSGMGMHLLKKMGWTPGQGLGKDQNGSLTPLLLELKFDKRGLEANEEILRQKSMKGKKGGGGGPRGGAKQPISMDALLNKHPVSLLGELASKRKWGAPNYTLVNESGPPHARNFIFKIRLNGIDYTCPTVSNNKKEAKSAVARFTLQQLGILPP